MKTIDRVRQHWRGKGFDESALGVRQSHMNWDRIVDANKQAGTPAEIVAVANTATIDMEREVVVPEGLDPKYFRTYKAVYWNHDYGALPVATLRSATLDRGKRAWMVRCSMASHPFAQDVLTTIRDGAINGGSIGFVRRDFGRPTDDEIDEYGPTEMVTRKGDLLEWSITPMPCNPDAEIVGRSLPDLPSEKARALESLVRKGLIHRKSAEAMGLVLKRPVVEIEKTRVVVI